MLSFWEKQHLLTYDVIIVGSGIVGLSTAISLKQRSPHKSVLVLERGIFPTGASTKNAGFACVGSLTEIIDDLQVMSEEEVLSIVEMRKAGLARLRKRLGDDAIGYRENGSYELIGEKEEDCLEKMDEVNRLLLQVTGKISFEAADHLLPRFGFNQEAVKHLVRNTCEGEINTGMMMRALIQLALLKGVEIKTGCTVRNVEEESANVVVEVDNIASGEKVAFSAVRVAICTNAFTGTLLPELDIRPGRGQVLITKPIDGLPFKGIFHFDKGYYYFREIEGRVLFGGGRNLDFRGESTTEFGANELIRKDLLDRLRNIILPGKTVEIDDWWTGIMAFGSTKTPILKAHSGRIFLGVRMGGMGVAIGSEVGERLAEMM